MSLCVLFYYHYHYYGLQSREDRFPASPCVDYYYYHYYYYYYYYYYILNYYNNTHSTNIVNNL